MYHILVVAEDRTNTKMIRFLLAEEGHTVATQLPGTALDALAAQGYDLVVLAAPGVWTDTVELCSHIRSTFGTPIMLLSPDQDVTAKVAALRAGADDYLSMPFDPSEFLARAQALLRRYKEFSAPSEQLASPDLVLNIVDNSVTLVWGKQSVQLTPIEARLLRCLMRNAGRIVTRDTLVARVWGHGYETMTNELDVYIRRLRAKIEPNPRDPRFLLTSRGIGYKFDSGTPADTGATFGRPMAAYAARA
jgi:two-component system response regulator RegX3